MRIRDSQVEVPCSEALYPSGWMPYYDCPCCDGYDPECRCGGHKRFKDADGEFVDGKWRWSPRIRERRW